VVYQKYIIRGRENGKEGGGGREQLTHVQRKRESRMRKRGEEGEKERKIQGMGGAERQRKEKRNDTSSSRRARSKVPTLLQRCSSPPLIIGSALSA